MTGHTVSHAVGRVGSRRRRRVLDRNRPIWMGEPHPIAVVARAIVLGVGCLAVVVPFASVIMTSLASQAELSRNGGFVLWTTEPSLAAYRVVLSGGIVTRALLISAVVTLVGTIASLTVTTCLAYGLSRPGSFLHKPILMLTLLTLFFAPGIIPMYLTVKQFGLVDHLGALILPVLVNAFNVIVMRAFFLDIPHELVESAKIDGASDWQILLRITLPLSRAVIAVIGLFLAVGYWNAFFSAMLYLTSPDQWPLTLVLRTFVVNQTPIGTDALTVGSANLPPQASIQMAILVISIVPILLVYPLIQKHFSKGLMIGAVKG